METRTIIEIALAIVTIGTLVYKIIYHKATLEGKISDNVKKIEALQNDFNKLKDSCEKFESESLQLRSKYIEKINSLEKRFNSVFRERMKHETDVNGNNENNNNDRETEK